ncbi:histone-lysine N-methyltransferase SETMAR-like, partial [Pseudomyrmex gracilis]|uniref:histone-lysine N-methyltransferase SETMAR-like n=1 Tax=Pseudomyrmex gracilis TaxID=219809 RepID=UPI000994E89A
MSEEKEEIRYILKFYFKKGKNATQAAKKICDVYGHDAVSIRVAQSWFKRFQSGNFDVKDAPRSGRPITEKVDEIMKIIEQDRHISSHEIGKQLNIDHKTVLNHLQNAGYKKNLDVWVPHDLTVKNLMDRFSICESLLKRNDIEPFLKRLITGNEKWITYDNNVRKRSWTKRNEAPQTVAKPKLTPRKVMLSVWWDWKGIVHYELLPSGQTIDSNLYCQQLERLRQAIEKTRPEL